MFESMFGSGVVHVRFMIASVFAHVLLLVVSCLIERRSIVEKNRCSASSWYMREYFRSEAPGGEKYYLLARMLPGIGCAGTSSTLEISELAWYLIENSPAPSSSCVCSSSGRKHSRRRLLWSLMRW